MPTSPGDQNFPCALTICVPLPTHRLASSALRALSVDAELSPLVRRSFSLAEPGTLTQIGVEAQAPVDGHGPPTEDREKMTILRTEYKATTNRMLRVAVNGFMESLGVVLGVMEELDVDVLAECDD